MSESHPPLAAAVVGLLWVAEPVIAHRLDEYLQAATLDVGKDRVVVQVRLAPGVEVLRAVLSDIDADGDGVISEVEQRAYAERVLRDLSLVVGGRMGGCPGCFLGRLRLKHSAGAVAPLSSRHAIGAGFKVLREYATTHHPASRRYLRLA